MPEVRFGKHTSSCLILTFRHDDMPTFAQYDRVKFGAEHNLLAAVTGPDADSFGHVYQQNNDTVDVIVDGQAVILVRVGAGQTATRGKRAVMHSVANTYKDATTEVNVAGRFLASGVANDYVPLLVAGVAPNGSAGGVGAGNAGMQVDKFGALPTSATNNLKTAFASSTSIQNFTWADLNGTAVSGGALDHPRTVKINQSATVGAFVNGNVTITGTCRGEAVSATRSITLNGGATVETTKCFDINEDLTFSFPACANGTGQFTIGLGDGVAFSALPSTDDSGIPHVVDVWVDGIEWYGAGYSINFNGTTTAPPYGSVTFSSPAPDGSAVFTVAYLVDA